MRNLQPPHPFHLLDVRLPKGATFRHTLPGGWNGAALVVRGGVAVAGENGGRLRGEQAAELVGAGDVQVGAWLGGGGWGCGSGGAAGAWALAAVVRWRSPPL